MVTSGLATVPSCVGPSSFLRVSVARMGVILALSRPPYIGYSQRPEGPGPLGRAAARLRLDGARDPQRRGAWRGGFQPVHAAPGDPDDGWSGEQRAVLLDGPGRGLVDVAVLAAGDVDAATPADLHALDVRAAQQQLLQVLAGDPTAGLGEDQPGV